MINALVQVFIGTPLRIAADVSTSLYEGVQRVVALSVLTNQRYNYFSSSINDLKTRRLTILSTTHEDIVFNRQPKVAQVYVTNDQGNVLEGIVIGPKDRITFDDGKPKVSDRLLVAYSGIGGCYENWYFEGLKDLYENFNASILLVNYRGVGKSQGRVVRPSDLIDDGWAVAMYAYHELSLDPSKIHFYGASMGGGVATHVVSRLEKEGYKPASVCIDRSYSGLLQTVHNALPVSFLKTVAKKIMMYASWQIDSFQAAMQIAYTQLVVIRSEADSVIPQTASLGTALVDSVTGRAKFKLIDLPREEKTDYEMMSEPEYPYWVKYELEKSYTGLLTLKYMEWQSAFQKILIGIKAHCVPFSKELYPLQTKAYEKVLIGSERELLLEN